MNGATLWIGDSVIVSNMAGTYGGAIWAKDCSVIIRTSTIKGIRQRTKVARFSPKARLNLPCEDVNFQNNTARKGNDVWKQ